jgi:CheY-like chemotaxis protein
MAFDRGKFVARFVEEAREHVGKLNEGLLLLEKDPGDTETLKSVVRSAHTVKGSSRMLKLTAISKMAHRLEDVLEALRSGKLKHSKGAFDILFMAIDIISDMVERTAGGEEVREAAPDIYEKLEKAAGEEEKEAINILVVDDSLNTREIEKEILQAYGYNVTLAVDGVDGLEKAREFRYDVVILDIEMPRMDGFSLTEKLRAEEAYKDTPIIIVTSREKEEDRRRGIEVGADAYIFKGSFDQSNLLEVVRSLAG